MKKPANWNPYFRKELSNPEMRRLIEEEIESLRALQLAKCMRNLLRLRRSALSVFDQ